MSDREEIANKIADEGWCPEGDIEYIEADGGYLITKTMFISDIDQYIAEMALCHAEEKLDAERDERLIAESEGGEE